MYRKTTLDNGIRVITEEMPGVRSVAMGLVVEAGMRNDPCQKNGLAHLVEHLMFQGTYSRDSLQIAHFMDEAGGRIGGYTAREYTCYSATVLDDYRTFALDLLGDILLNSIFLSEDIEREKETILREIDAFYDLPDNRTDALLKSYTWAGHPLGRPITGKYDTVSGITRADIVDYVKTYYQPDRLIIAAAGSLEHEDLVAQVMDAFWCMKKDAYRRMASPPRQGRDCPPKYQPGIAVEYKPVSQVYFSIGIRAPHYSHPDRYALHILNKIIGDGISARLFRRIRDDQGLVYQIGSEYQAFRDGGLLIVRGSTKPASFQQVLDQALTVMLRLIMGDDPVQAEELRRAKNQIKGQHLIAAEDTNTRMCRLATQEFYFGRHISTREITEQIEAVDIAKLEDITQNVLAGHLSAMAIAIVGPRWNKRYETITSQALQTIPVHQSNREKTDVFGPVCQKNMERNSKKTQRPRECHWCQNRSQRQKNPQSMEG
jgi:predicted Zn-dependent peptidase